MLLIRWNSAAAKVVRSGEPLLLLAPSLRVIGSPLEMLDGEPQLARMRRVILMCATAVLAAGAAQPPMPQPLRISPGSVACGVTTGSSTI
jgi:hypothetical protein